MTEKITIPVAREELGVTKEWVETARVRVQKNVHELGQQVDMMLGEEQVEVERIPMDEVVDRPPAARYEGDTLVVPVLEEVLVVEKRYRIKEELRITKVRKETRHTATIPVMVEEAVVERFDEGARAPHPSDQHRKRQE
ncbi:MAG TPA: DUF2382 domain-containing protein [Telluria sp.]|nr:DUF2382 domain-containing protein [Telluria sp.]